MLACTKPVTGFLWALYAGDASLIFSDPIAQVYSTICLAANPLIIFPILLSTFPFFFLKKS